MMKIAALSLLAGSAAAFAPTNNNVVRSTSLNAEKSVSLPFMNRPPLVSFSQWLLSACLDGFDTVSIGLNSNLSVSYL
jgi:hypothetical protein